MKLITITDRKTGETTRQVDPEPVGIDYKPLAAELARLWVERTQHVERS